MIVCRSQFLHVFGSSPDETAFFRIYLLTENVTNMTLMIQPSLLSYSFHAPPGPVLLDVSSISPDKILLLDTFFNVVVFHGETIAEWKRQSYHEQPEYASFKQLLEAPQVFFLKAICVCCPNSCHARSCMGFCCEVIYVAK